MDPMDMRVLTLRHIGEKPEDDLEITLCAMTIKMLTAKDVMVQGREAKETSIHFLDSDSVTVNLNHIDYLQLTNVVGAYGFYEG